MARPRYRAAGRLHTRPLGRSLPRRPRLKPTQGDERHCQHSSGHHAAAPDQPLDRAGRCHGSHRCERQPVILMMELAGNQAPLPEMSRPPTPTRTGGTPPSSRRHFHSPRSARAAPSGVNAADQQGPSRHFQSATDPAVRSGPGAPARSTDCRATRETRPPPRSNAPPSHTRAMREPASPRPQPCPAAGPRGR